jgi:oligopeptide/dipeptide ABC transporter ATP-binding protein
MAHDDIEIRELVVTFLAAGPQGEPARAVRGVSMVIEHGSVHALVGESGSGKSVTARSILGIVGADAHVAVNGSITYHNSDLLSLPEKELQSIRGREIAMIFQEPDRYLNPSLNIGVQIGEVLEAHFRIRRRAALKAAREMLAEVELPERVAKRYPHELSGGMKQRAMIAMALMCDPAFLIADEPTTSLDVTVQRQILDLLLGIQARSGMGMLFISHDLAVVQSIAHRISVMYAGKIVETAQRDELFHRPLHPYTQQLLLAVPHPGRRGIALSSIPGRPPDPHDVPAGCAFHPRCPLAGEICRTVVPIDREFGMGHSAACHMIEAPTTGGGAQS